MVKAGCPKGGVVLDPFAGAFTTALVALSHGRSTIGIEANPTYCDMGRERISKQATLLFANMDFTRNAAAAAGLVLGTGTAPPPFQGATAPNPSEESSL
jgi:DNA modification methylase